MLSRYLLSIFLLLSCHALTAQTGKISGTVKDGTNGEPLVGATVLIAEGKGTVTDIDGNYSVEAPYGTYNVKVSFVGYDVFEKTVVLNKANVTVTFELANITMNEVVVTADIAKTRETPVAFTNLSSEKIEQELAGRDVAMLLNDLPGTQGSLQGGGAGDVKVTIRGFSQRNVAMMIDGIPLNDMETGNVFWSNWQGIELVTRTMQVQRGLGASRLAIPAIGGSINIITRGIEAKQSFSIGEEVGLYGQTRTSISYTSGKLKGGWGITAAGAFKRADGWADATNSIGGFYFLKIEKSFKEKHHLSLEGAGTPQSHGQRPYTVPIAAFDSTYAKSLGITSADFHNANGTSRYYYGLNRGLRYNPMWGYVERRESNTPGDTTSPGRKQLNSSYNNYQKPQINLKYSFNINPKLYWTTTAYLSIGRGGGTAFGKGTNGQDYNAEGQINMQRFYDGNRFSPFSIDPQYSNTLRKAGQFLYYQNNDHLWYGVLSNINYDISKVFTLNAGIDLRDYKGSHYGSIADLLGADYVEDGKNYNSKNPMKMGNDKIIFYNENKIRWAGSYVQLEVKKNRWTAFLGITGSYSGYKKIDYFQRKDLVLSDTIYRQALGINDNKTITRNGVTYDYNSKQARYSQVDWKWIPGYTFKAGVSYKINDYHSVFVNGGYLSKAPLIRNVIDPSMKYINEIKNEVIKSVELGYNIKYPKFTANLNGYFTVWNNRPVSSAITVVDPEGNQYKANLNGLNARHAGVELEVAYRIIKQLQVEGGGSFADWRWTSKDTVTFYQDNGQPLLNADSTIFKQSYDARNVHVGDAPQANLNLALRAEPIKGLYLKVKASYFMKYYSQFDPSSLNGPNAGRDSWMMPSYGYFDFFAGYKWQVNKRNRLDFNIAVLNFTNKKYISDANNNDSSITGYTDFDAKSASVFFGMPITFTAGIKYTFF